MPGRPRDRFCTVLILGLSAIFAADSHALIPAFLGGDSGSSRVWIAPEERPGQPAPVPVSPVSVRVRVFRGQASVLLRGFDLQIFRMDRGAPAIVADRVSEWVFSCGEDGVYARPKDLVSAKTTRAPFRVGEGVWVESPSGFLSVQGRPYRENMLIYPTSSKELSSSGCDVVNEVDLEKYLDGLVNAEFSSGWSEAAVEAQVIAARTYALHQIKKTREDPSARYDLESTVADQVYDGSYREDYRAARSVLGTRGLVLVSSDAAPIKAFYHSTCGGLTELPERVWGKSYPGFGARAHCPYCKKSPAFEWKAEFSEREVLSLVTAGAVSASQALLTGPASPADWRLKIRYASSLEIRAERRASKGDRNTEWVLEWFMGRSESATRRSVARIQIQSATLRKWLGPIRFRSAWFRVQKTGARFVFSGRGYGHGVGLCQWGAKGMGENGYSAKQILNHYYSAASLKKLW